MSAGLSGLPTATAGTAQLKQGLQTSRDYLLGLQNASVGQRFYVPGTVLAQHQLAASFANYLSANHHVAKLTVVLKADQNAVTTLSQVKQLRRDVQALVKSTALKSTRVAVGGQTSLMADLATISRTDLVRTAVIMLGAIGGLLMLLTRSVTKPLVILVTLLGSVILALEGTWVFSQCCLHQSALTWNTPFFTLIMLVALGVDYSIFLLIRYQDNRELRQLAPKEAMQQAAAAIGKVVIAAAIILGGTFAALIPSGVLTLLQVAIAVILGLALLVCFLSLVMAATVELSNQ